MRWEGGVTLDFGLDPARLCSLAVYRFGDPGRKVMRWEGGVTLVFGLDLHELVDDPENEPDGRSQSDFTVFHYNYLCGLSL